MRGMKQVNERRGFVKREENYVLQFRECVERSLVFKGFKLFEFHTLLGSVKYIEWMKSNKVQIQTKRKNGGANTGLTILMLVFEDFSVSRRENANESLSERNERMNN